MKLLTSGTVVDTPLAAEHGGEHTCCVVHVKTIQDFILFFLFQTELMGPNEVLINVFCTCLT